MTQEIKGELRVRIVSEHGHRRIYMSVDGMPDWLLGMIRDSVSFKVTGTMYKGGKSSSEGPDVVSLQAEKIFVHADAPAPLARRCAGRL